MRALKWLRDFVEWRWAPFVGLVGGTLIYVVMMVLLIPSSITSGPSGTAANLGSKLGTKTSEQSRFGGENTTNVALPPDNEATPPPSPPPVQALPPPVQTRRGFSPPLERAEPPAQPAPVPTPNVIVPQPTPEPAPAAAEPPPPPEPGAAPAPEPAQPE